MSRFNNDDFNKELKDMAKDIDIEVPESLRKSVLDTLDKLPEKKVKKKPNYKKVAGFLVAGLLTFNVVMPVYAENLPLIGPTFKSINEAIGYGEKYVDKAKDIDMSKTYDGVTMTIKNIYYDGIELAIAYEIKSENGFEKKPVIFPIIKEGLKNIQYRNDLHKGEFTDGNTYVGIATYVFERGEMSDKTKLTFLVNDIYGEWVGYYPEKFKFRLKLDAKDMGKTTYLADKEFISGNNSFKITDVIVSPYNTIVNYKADVDIIRYESYGEMTSDVAEYLSFYIIDDKGMPLEFKQGTGPGNYDTEKDNRAKSDAYWGLSGVSKDAKSITIIPVIRKNGIYQWGENDNSNNFIPNKINKDSETEIKVSDSGQIIVKNIEFKEDKTIINIKFKKYIDHLKYPGIEFYDEDNNEIEILGTKFNGIDNGYDFTFILPKLDENKNYFIPVWKSRVNNVVLENQKFTIDLNNR